jgi:C-terminal processing protease CtpA/Prc
MKITLVKSSKMLKYIHFLLIFTLFSSYSIQTVFSLDQKTSNVEAFAKLFGYIRYFHPSDEASLIDWDAFAVDGVSKAKNAKNNEELEKLLKELFYPIAPTIQIYQNGEKPSVPIIPKDTTGLIKVFWQHLGIGNNNPGNAYKSVRTNRNIQNSDISFKCYRQLNPADFLNRESEFKLIIDAEFSNKESYFTLEAACLNIENNENNGMNYTFDTIKVSGKSEASVKFKVSDKISSIYIGFEFIGQGKVLVDDAVLSLIKDNSNTIIKLSNSSFEEYNSEGKPNGWITKSEFYNSGSNNVNPITGKASFEIKSKDEYIKGAIFDLYPKSDEYFDKELISGLRCRVPLVLLSDSIGTIGKNPLFPFDTAKYKLAVNNQKEEEMDKGYATFASSISVEKYESREFKFKGAVRTEVFENGNIGCLWVNVTNKDGSMGFFDNMQNRPITANNWEYYEINGRIDIKAQNFNFGGFLVGKGKAWFDDFHLFIKDTLNNWEEISIKDNNFETDTLNINTSSWYAQSPGYIYKVTDENPKEGTKCFIIYKDTTSQKKEYSLMDENVRLADVIISWNVIQHFFPYFEYLSVDWDKSHTTALQTAYFDSEPKDFIKVLERMLEHLQDGHLAVTCRDYPQDASLPFIAEWTEGKAVITNAIDSINFKIGDIITEIQNKPIDEYLIEHQNYIVGSNQCKLIKYFRWGNLVRGMIGDSIQVSVIRSEKKRTMNVNLIPKSELYWMKYYDKESIYSLDTNIYYINIGNVTMEDFEKKLNEFKKAKGIIVDLRFYPTTDNFPILSYFSEKTLNSPNWNIPKIIYPDRDNIKFDISNWQIDSDKTYLNCKKIFIIDGATMSAGETMASIIQINHLGQTIGQPTAGANGNVNTFDIPGNINIIFTGMKVLNEDNSRHFIKGIVPDIIVNKTIKAVKEGRDEYIEKAIELLKQ